MDWKYSAYSDISHKVVWEWGLQLFRCFHLWVHTHAKWGRKTVQHSCDCCVKPVPVAIYFSSGTQTTRNSLQTTLLLSCCVLSHTYPSSWGVNLGLCFLNKKWKGKILQMGQKENLFLRWASWAYQSLEVNSWTIARACFLPSQYPLCGLGSVLHT